MIRFLTVGFLLICINLNAQSPAIEWHKCLGSNFSDYAKSVQPTLDGGFIIAGFSTGSDNGDVMGHHGNSTVGDFWIVKLDKTGNIEWQKSLGGSDSEQSGFIIQTADGGYVLAGGAASNGCEMTGNKGASDFWVAKLSDKGDMLWQKMYGGSSTEVANSVAPSGDGGYFVTGMALSNDGDVTGNHGNSDYWVIKIDATGKLIWQKSLGGTEYEVAASIQATADGGCIVAGTAGSNNGDVTGHHGSGDYWVVKLDDKGNKQWDKALGGSFTEQAECILVAADGGYIVSGSSNSFDGDATGAVGRSYDAWVVKLDTGGKIIWQKSYGGSSVETAKYIQNTPGGGYVFTGGSLSANGDVTCNAGHYDLLVMKISSAGALEWQKTMGGADFDEGYCIQPLNDGSFIVAGSTASSNIAGYHTPVGGGIYDDTFDYWLIKLSAPLANTPAPVVKIDPASAIICAGKQATVRASVLYGGVNPVYQWMKNGLPVGTNSSLYTDLNFADNDQVTCIVKNGNVCENAALEGSDVITIKLKSNAQNPTITINADNNAACNCATITVKATVANAGGSPQYKWMVNGNDVGSNAPIMISNKLKDGDVITCSYADNTGCAGPVLSNEIKIGGGNITAPSVTIVVAADTVCKGSTVVFTANATNAGTNPVYQWKLNNSNTGTNSPVFSSSTLPDGAVISCSIQTDPLFTCTPGAGAISNVIVLHVVNKVSPSLNVAASAETICTGSPVTFTATATSAGANVTYQWKINGVNTGTNDKVYSNSSLANNDIVNCIILIDPLYSCALTNQVVSQNIRMTVTPGSAPAVEISADRNNVCGGDKVTFTAVARDAGANPTFQWLVNDAVLLNSSAVYTSNRLASGDRVFCRVIPGAGSCTFVPATSNVVVAVIKSAPVVYISPADTLIANGMQVQLSAVVTGNIISFQWNPAGKLINPLLLNPQTSSLIENTSYMLVVTDDKGCRATATAVVKIGTELYMPNAFTPNNDGVNDLFRIPLNAILDLKEFSIYNRWGERVFTTANRNSGWNGQLKGLKQDNGVYVYYIKSIINNKDVFLKGSFLLIN
jgi:gliding motility-associated-like protein